MERWRGTPPTSNPQEQISEIGGNVLPISQRRNSFSRNVIMLSKKKTTFKQEISGRTFFSISFGFENKMFHVISFFSSVCVCLKWNHFAVSSFSFKSLFNFFLAQTNIGNSLIQSFFFLSFRTFLGQKKKNSSEGVWKFCSLLPIFTLVLHYLQDSYKS